MVATVRGHCTTTNVIRHNNNDEQRHHFFVSEITTTPTTRCTVFISFIYIYFFCVSQNCTITAVTTTSTSAIVPWTMKTTRETIAKVTSKHTTNCFVKNYKRRKQHQHERHSDASPVLVLAPIPLYSSIPRGGTGAKESLTNSTLTNNNTIAIDTKNSSRQENEATAIEQPPTIEEDTALVILNSSSNTTEGTIFTTSSNPKQMNQNETQRKEENGEMMIYEDTMRKNSINTTTTTTTTTTSLLPSIDMNTTGTTSASIEERIELSTLLRAQGKSHHDAGQYHLAANEFRRSAEILVMLLHDKTTNTSLPVSEEDEQTTFLIEQYAICCLHEALCYLKLNEYQFTIRACNAILFDDDEKNNNSYNHEQSTDSSVSSLLSDVVVTLVRQLVPVPLRARAYHRRSKAFVELHKLQQQQQEEEEEEEHQTIPTAIQRTEENDNDDDDDDNKDYSDKKTDSTDNDGDQEKDENDEDENTKTEDHDPYDVPTNDSSIDRKSEKISEDNDTKKNHFLQYAFNDAKASAYLGDQKGLELYSQLMRTMHTGEQQSSVGATTLTQQQQQQQQKPFSSSSSSFLLESLLKKSSKPTNQPSLSSFFNSNDNESSNFSPTSMILNSLMGSRNNIFNNNADNTNNDKPKTSLAQSILSSLSKRIEDVDTQNKICDYVQTSLSSTQLHTIASMAGMNIPLDRTEQVVSFCKTHITPQSIQRTVSWTKRTMYVVKVLQKVSKVIEKYRTILTIVFILLWIKSALLRKLPINKRLLLRQLATQKNTAVAKNAINEALLLHSATTSSISSTKATTISNLDTTVATTAGDDMVDIPTKLKNNIQPTRRKEEEQGEVVDTPQSILITPL